MLCEAGAPEPWAAAAERFAAGITFRWPAPGDRKLGKYDRATDAIAELRRVLPDIIADDEHLVAALDDPPSEFQHRMVQVARSRAERELADLRRLLAALPELRWELRKPRTPPWHLDAARLYTLYRRHVDPDAGISADGPSVRFIVLALKRMRSLTVEHLAVAKALQRLRGHSQRRWLDRSGGP